MDSLTGEQINEVKRLFRSDIKEKMDGDRRTSPLRWNIILPEGTDERIRGGGVLTASAVAVCPDCSRSIWVMFDAYPNCVDPAVYDHAVSMSGGICHCR